MLRLRQLPVRVATNKSADLQAAILPVKANVFCLDGLDFRFLFDL